MPGRQNFYPRPPRGGRHVLGQSTAHIKTFLSTPSARRATPWQSIHGRSTQFLSTPSARRATQAGYPSVGRRWYFYPRPPRGGRRQPSRCRVCSLYFYPRPPRGGRRRCKDRGRAGVHISIHALREEGDAGWGLTFDAVNEFLSTPSARRATGALLVVKHPERFLSTPSARRATFSARLFGF